MIIDSSAIIAVFRGETDHTHLSAALKSRARRSMSAATYLETAIVADRNPNPTMGRELDRLLDEAGIEIVAVTQSQARIARAAYKDFGRGSGHPARLNFGDCFAYALAVDRNEPLLYKGDNFGHTDVRNALEDS